MKGFHRRHFSQSLRSYRESRRDDGDRRTLCYEQRRLRYREQELHWLDIWLGERSQLGAGFFIPHSKAVELHDGQSPCVSDRRLPRSLRTQSDQSHESKRSRNQTRSAVRNDQGYMASRARRPNANANRRRGEEARTAD